MAMPEDTTATDLMEAPPTTQKQKARPAGSGKGDTDDPDKYDSKDLGADPNGGSDGGDGRKGGSGGPTLSKDQKLASAEGKVEKLEGEVKDRGTCDNGCFVMLVVFVAALVGILMAASFIASRRKRAEEEANVNQNRNTRTRRKRKSRGGLNYQGVKN